MRNMLPDLGGHAVSTRVTGEQMRGQVLPVANATIPYWRTQLHPIDEHRSTKSLPTECDIAIIGAGLAGVSTAHYIAALAGDEKPSIIMLEARQVCSGATGRNGVCLICGG